MFVFLMGHMGHISAVAERCCSSHSIPVLQNNTICKIEYELIPGLVYDAGILSPAIIREELGLEGQITFMSRRACANETTISRYMTPSF